MNLEDLRKKGEEFLAPSNVKVNQKAVKKALLAGGLILTNVGLGAVNYNLYTSANSNPAVVTEDKTNDNDESKIEIQNEYKADIQFGTNYDVVDQIETNIKTFMDTNISKGVYEISTSDQTQVEALMSEAFEDTYSAYLFANANTIYLKGNNAGKVLKAFGTLPTILDAQDYIEDLGLYSSKAGLPENLVDLFSSNTDRAFMSKFKSVIEAYENGNKGEFYQFLEDYENGKYSEASPFARMLMMNLARNHKATFADKCWDKKINVGKTEDGSIRRLDWWFYDEECGKVSTNDDKPISSLNSTCYTEMLAQLDTMNAFLTSTAEMDKFTNIMSHDELYNAICKELSEKYGIGTEANKAAYDAYYKLWKKVIELKKKAGITTTRTYNTGRKHVVSVKTINVSTSKLEDNVKPKPGEKKEVILDNGNKIIVTIDLADDNDKDKNVKDLTSQQGFNDALDVVDTYISATKDPKKNLELLKAHRYDYKMDKNSPYFAQYKKAFDEVMNESIKNLQDVVNNNLPTKTEDAKDDEKKEVVDKKTEDGPETTVNPKKEDTTDKKDEEDQKKDDTHEKQEETKKDTTTNDKKDEEVKNDKTEEDSEKKDINDKNDSDTLIPIGDSKFEDADGNDKGEIVNKKEEDSDEKFIEYKPEEHASKETESDKEKDTTSSLTKTVSKSSTSTRSKRLEQYKALKSDTEQVKTVIDQTQNQNETGKTK